MTILSLVKQQFNLRIYDESVYRILKVMDMLTEDQIWYRPNDQSNSIGNLVLHLCGNVTQWIGYGIGGQSDNRERAAEFDTESRVDKQTLADHLSQLRTITDLALEQLTDDHQLTETQTVQGFEETKMGIIIHVIEHFSYHTGQIAVIAKYLEGRDLGFYDNVDLTVTG